MQKLILRNHQSPGDLVMLTAAVRDIHRCYPRRYLTDVRTSCPQLWENNPYITPIKEEDPDVEIIECHYPLVQHSNQRPYHFIHGFIEFLNLRLKINIRPTLFKGDIHLSKAERLSPSLVHDLMGRETPFWILVAGGKNDFTIKWWDSVRFQQVVDSFKGKILFVQVGLQNHVHPELGGVLDLRGKTTIRELIRLVYHAQGVLCPVTFLMHLAAAVESKERIKGGRPCVVIAGGREPFHWEAYPNHQFIHTIGALRCCSHGGCWKSRTVPLGDGDSKDRQENLCVDVVGTLPKCMDIITVEEVIRRMDLYFQGGRCKYLS